jgi:hypothetical protein
MPRSTQDDTQFTDSQPLSKESQVESSQYDLRSQPGERSQRSQGKFGHGDAFPAADDVLSCSQVQPSTVQRELIPKSSPECVPQYYESVLTVLRRDDDFLNPRTRLFAAQTEIDKDLRKTLVFWVIARAPHLEIDSKTIFLALKNLDRLLIKKELPRDRFLFYGICCASMAAKFENVIHPSLQSFVRLSTADLSEDDIIQTELEIFEILDFRVNTTTVVLFLKIFLNDIPGNSELPPMVLFIALCSLISPDIAIMKSELLALTILLIALNALELDSKPTCIVQLLEKFDYGQIQECADSIITSIEEITEDEDCVINTMFSAPERCSVALRGPFRLPEL